MKKCLVTCKSQNCENVQKIPVNGQNQTMAIVILVPNWQTGYTYMSGLKMLYNSVNCPRDHILISMSMQARITADRSC